MTPPHSRLRRRPAVTLIEMMVLLVILSIVFSIAGLTPALGRAPTSRSEVARARERAIETGQSVTVSVPMPGMTRFDSGFVTALPDGSVIADTALHVDWLTGTPQAVAVTPRPQDESYAR